MNKKVKVNLVIPAHLTEFLVRNATLEALVLTGQYIIQAALWAQAIRIRGSATDYSSDAELPKKIEIMDS